SDAASDRDDDRASKQVEAYTTCEVAKLPPATPNSALCGLGLWLLGHVDVDRGFSSLNRMLRTRRMRIIARNSPRRMLARSAHRRRDGHLAPEWYPIGGRVYLRLDPGARLR